MRCSPDRAVLVLPFSPLVMKFGPADPRDAQEPTRWKTPAIASRNARSV